MQHVLLSVDKRQAFFGLLIRIAFPHVFLPYEVFRGGLADLQPVDNAFAGLGLPFGQQAALIFPTQVEVAGIVYRNGIGRYLDLRSRAGGKGCTAEVGLHVAICRFPAFRVGAGIRAAQ